MVLSSAAVFGIAFLISTLSEVVSFNVNPSFASYRFHSPERIGYNDKLQFGMTKDDASAVAESKETKDKIATLRFLGKLSYRTEPAPLPNTDQTNNGKSIDGFFSQKESTYVLLQGAGGNDIDPIKDPSAEDIEKWAKEAKRMGSQPPGPEDELVTVITDGIKFPGIKTNTISKIGTKLVLDSAGGCPQWQATMASDETKAEGLRPLVWVFNKLTGASKKKSDDDQIAHSFACVSVEVSDGEVVFTSDAILEVDIKVPSLLLKILPVNKEKAEEQGSDSMQKALEKDVGPAMMNFREEYIKYLSQ